MKKLLFSAAIAAMASMASCSDNASDISENPAAEKLPISISTALSRVTDYAFEVGDKVGVFVVNEPNSLAASGNHVDNMGFTCSDKWTPDAEIYWLDKTTKADLYCYYPYAETVDATAHPFATKADQSALADYKASEFLWGRTAGVAPTEEAVGITVKHTFSNVVVILKAGAGFTEETFAAASKSVRICNVRTAATVDLATGIATATGVASSVTPYNEGDYYRALIVPQTVAEGALIQATVNGTDYTLSRGFTFRANTQHKFTVTVNKVNNGVNIGIGGWDVDDSDNGGSAE